MLVSKLPGRCGPSLPSVCLTLFLAATAVAFPTFPSILTRQNSGLPDVAICTCSSWEKGISRTTGICRAAGGQDTLITAFAESNEDNAGIPPTASWNTCFISGTTLSAAGAVFSDANCASRFGDGFTGDCVGYPGTPGVVNIPFGPAQYCKKGRQAVPDCALTGLVSCTSPFGVYPACCKAIADICSS